MFKIQDGRTMFYQWDIDRKLIVEDANIKEVHFCNKTDECSLVCNTYVEEGQTVVNVPNILLQSIWRIYVYAYDENYTKFEADYSVKPRSKPADYVYTETEIKRYETLEERIEALENGGSGGGSLPEAAAPYQQLVSDKDGNTVWEERTHYAEYTEVVFMPYQEVQLTDDGMTYFIEPILDYDVEVGKTYTVKYNDVDYECISVEFPQEGIKGQMLGNTSIASDEPDITKEPFLLVLINNLDTDGIYGMLVDTEGVAKTVSIEVSGKHYTYKTLNENYLPDNIRNQAKKIKIQLREDMSGMADMSFKEAWEMDECQLQSAINVYSYDGEEKYSAFAIGKYKTENYYDFIQFSIQIPTDTNMNITTHVFLWWGKIGESLGETNKEIQHSQEYKSLPSTYTSADGQLEVLAMNSSGNYEVYNAEAFYSQFRASSMYIKSNSRFTEKFYIFNMDDDRNIRITENKSGSEQEVDTIVKKSDLDAALAALVDGEEVKY